MLLAENIAKLKTDGPDALRKEKYDALWRLVKETKSEPLIIEPAATIGDVARVTLVNKSPSQASLLPTPEQMGELLVPRMVRSYVGYALSIAPYMILLERPVSPTPKLFSEISLRSIPKDTDSGRQEARSLLQYHLWLLNVAVAQEALLSGDALLPLLARAPAATSQKLVEQGLDIATKDERLRKNLGRYIALARKPNPTPFYYRFLTALSTDWDKGLAELVNSPIDGRPVAATTVKRRADGVWVVVRKWGADKMLEIELPESTDEDQLEWTEELKELLTLRHRVVDELVGLDVGEKLTPSERQRLVNVVGR